MTREQIARKIDSVNSFMQRYFDDYREETYRALQEASKLIKQEPIKGEWLRMSDLSEQEDDRYKCSCCGNVVHYKNKMYLYTFNSWCGRCGSDNNAIMKREDNENDIRS